jgi:hypothetical protein
MWHRISLKKRYRSCPLSVSLIWLTVLLSFLIKLIQVVSRSRLEPTHLTHPLSSRVEPNPRNYQLTATKFEQLGLKEESGKKEP